jgi:hypothetical protein
MDIVAIFEKYTNDLGFVYDHQAAIRKESELEFQRLLNQEVLRVEANLPIGQIFGMHNHSFRTAVTGEHFFYDFKDYTIEAQMTSLVTRTNRQYQWLLAEAYELFEDFLEHFYAAVALVNRNLWPLKDYGAMVLSELESASFETLLGQARSKREKPQSLLYPLRTKLPLLSRFESQNALKTDLWFAMNFIEKLRHHIVHTKGMISSKSEFTDQLLRRCGTFNKGKPSQSNMDLIDSFIAPRGNACFVRLLDMPLPPCGTFSQYVDMFGELSGYLPAYAHLLASCFVRLQSMSPPSDSAMSM